MFGSEVQTSKLDSVSISRWSNPLQLLTLTLKAWFWKAGAKQKSSRLMKRRRRRRRKRRPSSLATASFHEPPATLRAQLSSRREMFACHRGRSRKSRTSGSSWTSAQPISGCVLHFLSRLQAGLKQSPLSFQGTSRFGCASPRRDTFVCVTRRVWWQCLSKMICIAAEGCDQRGVCLLLQVAVQRLGGVVGKRAHVPRCTLIVLVRFEGPPCCEALQRRGSAGVPRAAVCAAPGTFRSFRDQEEEEQHQALRS